MQPRASPPSFRAAWASLADRFEPDRPLRKGRIELKPSVAELFDGHSLQAVLHLLSDPRGFNGAGESEFFRGALWIAPVTF